MEKKKIALILFIIQIMLIIGCLVLLVLYFLGNESLLDVLEMVMATDLILMGISNYLIHKKVKYALVNIIVGIFIFLLVFLKKIGVM